MFLSWQTILQRFAVITSSTFCLALVFSTGPQIQNYVLSLINSDVPSVYGSAHQQNLVSFPKLADWLSQVLYWPFFIMGLVVSFFATRSQDSRLIAWNTASASAIVLSITDIGIGIFDKQISVKWITENIISNLIGGAAVSAILICIFLIADFIINHLPLNNRLRNVLSLFSVPLGGLVYCCAIYYIIGLFYEPLPSKVDITISAPSHGFIAPLEQSNNQKSDKHNRTFSFAPTKSFKSNIKWISPKKVEVTGKFDNNRAPNLSIFLVSGCTTLEQLSAIQTWPDAWISKAEITSFNITSDNGGTDFMTMIPSKERINLQMNAGTASLFSFGKEKDSTISTVTQFVGEEAFVDLKSSHSLKFYLAAPLLSENNKEIKTSPRMIKLSINGAEQFIRLWPPKSIRDFSKKIECQTLKDLKSPKLGEGEGIDIELPDPFAGVVVTISQPVDEKRMSFADVGIRVESSTGWVSIQGFESEDLDQQALGQSRMIQVRGNISEFSLDGTSQSPRQMETITAVGSFDTQLVQGKIRLWGQAKNLWKDKDRLNSTRWEKLSWEPKLFILSLMISAFTLFCKLFINKIKINHRFNWIK